jgi:hypothetical protein
MTGKPGSSSAVWPGLPDFVVAPLVFGGYARAQLHSES